MFNRQPLIVYHVRMVKKSKWWQKKDMVVENQIFDKNVAIPRDHRP